MNLSVVSPSHCTSGLGQAFGWLKFRDAKPSVRWSIIDMLKVVMAALAGHEGRHRNEEMPGLSGDCCLVGISQLSMKGCNEF